MKPVTGYLSEGVVRVESLADLEAGVQTIDVDRHGADFAIEKYCEGPEVDANFVLCDGELLFFEASDELPKGADVNGQGNLKSFIEIANILPSKLPESELALLRDSLHQSLLRVGFQNGIFHLEARIAHSSMEYVTKDGVLDLTQRSVPAKGTPSAWLIEINPRPPGIQASDASKHTYGVDYWGLGLLFALEDTERVKQLSYPFKQGPQYWCEMIFIPVEKGGVFDSEDVCTELFRRRPDLADCVSWCHCFFTKGDLIPDPSTGVNSWVAHFNVFSRSSRAGVLEIAECIRKEVRFSVV
jgi:biotin carboxylase